MSKMSLRAFARKYRIGSRVTVSKNDWLRLLPRETVFFKKIFFVNETIVDEHVWACQDGLACIFFVIQVCFSLAHLCFVGIFGWWVCYLGLVRFFCVVSAFLRRRETKQFCCFRCVFLVAVFWPAVLLFYALQCVLSFSCLA